MFSLFFGLAVTVGAVEFFDPTKLSVGVCYYPEQWNQSMWEADAAEMAALGIQFVRIAEFTWSHLEPARGQFQWAFLDQAIDVLHAANLSVIIGTPTATPPKWLVDEFPSILPYDDQGRPRRFGSRRHYSFSSFVYRNETARLVTLMAERYGQHPGVVGWQLDNEYGCHDTVLTYDGDAKVRFRTWLQAKYSNNITKLNKAWGNVFWSMELNSFEEVDLPDLTVTEPNPTWRMDFHRFSSDMVVEYNLEQTAILRAKAPTHFLTTNFMGFFFQFDAFKVAESLDGATWDNYPLGFTDTSLGLGDLFTDQEKVKFHRTGHPDLASFHHDLYRAVGKGNFGVMEQQPGPVNWAANNPAPAEGMVRLWSWEAFAHGASVVSYFRWRRAPFAQEQMHSGIKRRDNGKDFAYVEVQQLQQEVAALAMSAQAQSSGRAAIAFEYEAFWMYTVEPQGAAWSYAKVVYQLYSALRARGINVDFVTLGRDSLVGYPLLIVPSVPFVSDEALASLQGYAGTVLVAPRTGSKTESFQVPAGLPPSVDHNTCTAGRTGCLQDLLPLKVVRVESFRADYTEELIASDGEKHQFSVWKEWLEVQPSSADVQVEVLASFEVGGTPAHVCAERGNLTIHYLAFHPTADFLQAWLSSLPTDVLTALKAFPVLSDTVRLQRRGAVEFAFNYDQESTPVPAYKKGAFVIGSAEIPGHGVSAWRCDCDDCCQPDPLAPAAEAAKTRRYLAALVCGGILLFAVVGFFAYMKRRRTSKGGALRARLVEESAHDDVNVQDFSR